MMSYLHLFLDDGKLMILDIFERSQWEATFNCFKLFFFHLQGLLEEAAAPS